MRTIPTSAGGSYSAITTQGNNAQIRFDIQMEPKGAVSGLSKVDKAYAKTGDTVKKQGEAAQRQMNKWGEAMEKAGKMAYDFGGQMFNSMTVMDAMKEGATGGLEMWLMGAIEGFTEWQPGKWAKGIAETLFGKGGADFVTEVLGLVGITQEPVSKKIDQMAEDWGDRLEKGIPTGFSVTALYSTIAAELNAGDATGVVTILNNKIAAGNFSGIDAAIVGFIGKGDWTYATKAINVALGPEMSKYPMVDEAIRSAIGTGDYDRAAQLIDLALSGYDFKNLSYAIAEAIGGPAAQDKQAQIDALMDSGLKDILGTDPSGRGQTIIEDMYDIMEKWPGTAQEKYTKWVQYLSNMQTALNLTDEQMTQLAQFYVLQSQLAEASLAINDAAAANTDPMGLNLVVQNFADKLKDPATYSGVGTAIWAAYQADMNNR